MLQIKFLHFIIVRAAFVPAKVYDDDYDDDNGYSSAKSQYRVVSKSHSTHNSADSTKAPSMHSHSGIFESSSVVCMITLFLVIMIPLDPKNSALIPHGELKTHITQEKIAQTRKGDNCRTTT